MRPEAQGWSEPTVMGEVSRVESQRRRRRVWSLGAGGLLGAAALLAVSAAPAQANYPDPPDQVQSLASESAPATCPTWAPAGTFPAGTNINALCNDASAKAPTAKASAAIRYMFSKLGASYNQSNRYSINPPVFDCTSFVSRAYTAAGASIIKNGISRSWTSTFGWTGAYMPSAYWGSNLRRLSNAPGNLSGLQPGDVLIQFAGSDPAGSAGNNGHAQVYLGYYGGRHLVIQSGGNHPQSLVNVDRHSNWFSNEWYFRYDDTPQADPIYAKWLALGGASSVLRNPLGAAFANPRGGMTRVYEGGEILWSSGTGAHEVYGGILQHYIAVGGAGSALGLPTSGETGRAVAGSRGNDFQGGYIMWAPGIGAHEVYGGIAQRYRALGADRSPLGIPVTGETDGPVAGSRMNRFTGGAIYWSGPTSAQEIYGGMAQRFLGANVAQRIGLPVSPERTASPGVQVQEFQRGAMYWSARTGAQEVYGGILGTYRALGAERSALGVPTAPEADGPTPGSRMQTFTGGTIYWSAPTGAHAVFGDFGARFASLGGVDKLGLPTSSVLTNGALQYQTFANGFIGRTSGQMFEVSNGMWLRYAELGRERSMLGLPLGPERQSSVKGAVVQEFRGGMLVWTPQAGANEVYGGILARYRALGADASPLGVPITGETAGPVSGSRMNTFTGGAIIWSGPTDAQAVYGGMAARYLDGSLAKVIGLPTGSERDGALGGVRVQDYQRGKMYWSVANGAHEVYGGILNRYRALGEERSGLGVPTSGEVAGPVTGSRMNTFANGAIVWSGPTDAQPLVGAIWDRFRTAELAAIIGLPRQGDRPAAVGGARIQDFQRGVVYSSGAGTYEVYGGILATYQALGAERSALGLPRSGEVSGGLPGSRMNGFQGGAIYWSPTTGSHGVYGAIYAQYAQLGAEKSRLGLPTRSEYAIPGGRASDFTGGRITWDSRTGALTVTYK